MRRFFTVFILGIFCCSFLVACQKKDNTDVCSYCGADVSENAKYCSQCGEHISVEEKTETNEFSVETPPSAGVQNDYVILDSGKCNENISWEIRSNGTLYIYGNGAVPSYEEREVDGQIAPWRASPLVSEITDVVIGDGVSGLGENLFYRLTLDTLYLGQNVRVFDHTFSYFFVENIYIPKCFDDIYFLLCEASAEKERYGNYPITVYYEGTEDDWNEQKRSETAWRNNENFQDVTVFFNYAYK